MGSAAAEPRAATAVRRQTALLIRVLRLRLSILPSVFICCPVQPDRKHTREYPVTHEPGTGAG